MSSNLRSATYLELYRWASELACQSLNRLIGHDKDSASTNVNALFKDDVR